MDEAAHKNTGEKAGQKTEQKTGEKANQMPLITPSSPPSPAATPAAAPRRLPPAPPPPTATQVVRETMSQPSWKRKTHPAPACPHCACTSCPAYKGADDKGSVILRYRKCGRCKTTFKTVARVLAGGFVGPEEVRAQK